MKKDKNYIYLILISIAVIAICIGTGNMFGSKTDWISQHSVFPDYFRNLFYETGKLIPNFAPHIGGGQNIFNFGYYGLLNPIYMISYLFPFIKMVDYIMIVSVISIIASTLLFYKWLKNNEVSNQVSFISSILFLTSAPLIFHFHRHLMFVNYMPFLLMALIGVQKYFEKKSPFLLVIGIFLMIMTSYYYSIGGLLTIFLYGIYIELKKRPFKLNIASKDLFKFGMFMLLGVLCAGVFLLPTASVILNSRTSIGEEVSFVSLLMPVINMDALVYSNYSLGLIGGAAIILVLGLLINEREIRTLIFCILIILTIPLFCYLLNGGLYLRSKVFIPMLPIVLFSVAVSLEKLLKKKVSLLYILTFLVIICFTIYITGYTNIWLFIEVIILFVTLFIALKLNKPVFLFLYLALVSIGFCIGSNNKEKYVSINEYKDINNAEITKNIKDIIEKDTDYYRFNNIYKVNETMNKVYDNKYYQTSLYSSTYNEYYKNFFDNEFRNALPLRNILDQVQVDNSLFNMFMGVKYVRTKNPPKGYELVSNEIYVNKSVLPLGYASSSLTSINDYKTKEYPYNLDYLLKSIVVNDKTTTNISSNLKEINMDYLSMIGFNKNADIYEMDTKGVEVRLKLDEIYKDKILIITFDILEPSKCSKGDLSISINGVTNKLTCETWMYYNNNESFEYIISTNGDLENLNFKFSKGNFKIGNPRIYAVDYSNYLDFKYDKFNVKSFNDETIGDIDVKEDGYFATTLPYDKGFKVYVDDKPVNKEIVNTSFLGFKIDKGKHNIKIVYEAPFLELGKDISVMSFGVLVFIFLKKKFDF